MSQKIIEVKFHRISNDFGDVDLPSYSTAGSSGADVRAAIGEDVVILPGEKTLIPTNFKCEIPYGYELQVRPRSGLSFNHGVTLINSPGTIDSDYRGEVKVMLRNDSDTEFTIVRGMRIAQIILAETIRMNVIEDKEMTETGRGDGGFGSTGLN